MNNLILLENELVPVYETDKGEKVVYGTELYKILEVKSPYREWSARRLKDCDAIEKEDFDSVEISTLAGGTPKKEHIIKLDTAKEMAMLERNEKGKQVRRYFIEVEKRYKEDVLIGLSKELKAVIVVDKRVTKIENQVKSVDKDLQEFKMDLPILGIEIDKITSAVNKRVVNALGGKESNAYKDRSLRGKLYSDLYTELKRQFGVTSYKAIKRNQSDLAIAIIEKYQLPFILSDLIRDIKRIYTQRIEVRLVELFQLLGKIAIDANGAETTIDSFSSKAENMAQKIGGSLKTVGDKLSLTGTVMTATVTTPLAILGKKAFTVASNFEDAMSQAAGALNKPIGQMGDLRQLALDMGESTIFSATEAGSAITELAKGGLSEAQIKGGALASTMDLAASAQMGLGDAANVVVQTMGAFRIGADDSSVAVNALAGAAAASSTDVQPLTYGLSQCAAMASNAGWEIAETTGVLGLFADAGINGSDAGTSLKTMLQRLAAPTDSAAKLIDQLGIRTRDSSGNLLGASEMAEELKVKLSGLSAEQRDAALATIFGSDATRAATVLMNSGSEGLRKYVEASNDQTAANRLAESQMGNNNRAIEEMNGAIETAAITVGEKLAPHITKLANWVKDLAVKFSGLDSSTQDSIIKFVAFVAAIGPVLIVVGKIAGAIGTVISVGGKLTGGMGNVVTVGKGLILFGSKIVTGIGTVATFIGGTLIPAIASIGAPVLIVIGVIGALVAAGVAVYKNWDEIKEFASRCWDGIKNVVGGAIEGIKGFFSDMGNKFGELKDNMTEKATQLKDKASEKITELKDKATSKITELKEKTVERLTEMRDKAVEKVGELKDNAVSRLSDLKDKLGSHVQAAKDKVVTGFTELKDGAGQKLTEFKAVADEKIDGFKESAVKKFTAFKDEAAAKITQLKDTGAEKLAELAKKGIAGFQDIRDKGNSAIDDLKNAVGQKFGEMGSAIVEKFSAVGTSIRTVFDNVKNAVSTIVDNIKSLFNFEWKLPDIKLPHFKLDGEFNLGPLTLPKIGVEWYAKGGIMNNPTAFGYNPLTNKIMGGGEAGPEAITPISVLQDYIRIAVAEKNEELIVILNALYGLLNTYLPMLSKMDLVMDTGEMVGALAVPMNQAIGAIARKEERIR